MGKKKKIREEFNVVFRSGDENMIRAMLKKYPWLFNEISHEMDEIILEQRQVIAALGVMEDELGGPVSIFDIEKTLRADFNIIKTEEEIRKILNDIESLRLSKKEINGWVLTSEGGRVCDDYLNKSLENFEL